MDLSGLAAFGSAVYPGFVQGQNSQALLQQNQERANQARIQSQELLDDRAALTALGNAFGVAPPNAPTPQGPGQPSAPAAPPPAPPDAGPPPLPATAAPPPPPQAGPPPRAPNPATQALAPAQGGAAPQPPAARPAPPPAPPPAAPPARAPLASPVAGTSGGPGGPVIPGQMTADQLAQRIVAANPQIKNRPDLLIRAMQKGQALLAPDAKADLAALQLQQKIDAANQKYEQGLLTLQNKLDLITQANQTKVQLQNLKDQGANDRLVATMAAKLDELTKKLDADAAKTDKTEAGKDKRNTETVGGRADVAATNADAGITKAQIAAGARSEAQGVTQQYRAFAMQAADINKKISGLLAGGRQLSDLKPDEKSQYDALTAQRGAIADKAQALADKAGKTGVKMPKFADEVKDAGKKPAASADAEAKLPDGLPPVPPGATDGTTAKDDSGQVVAVVKDGQWVAP